MFSFNKLGKKPSKLVFWMAAVFLFILCIGSLAQTQQGPTVSKPRQAYLEYQKNSGQNSGVPNYGYVPSPLDWSHLKSVNYGILGDTGKRSVSLPASYDIRDNMPAVKDQSPLGTCWTFSAAAATESNLIKQGIVKSSDIKLGEWYQAYFGYNDESDSLPAFDNSTSQKYYDIGGNDWMSVALLSRGTGSVLLGHAPYPTSETVVYKPVVTKRTYKITDALYLGDLNSEMPWLDAARRDMIKEAVMTYGAVSIGIYQDDIAALNPLTAAYFRSYDKKTPNHAVTLVGWDDNYAPTNFKAENRPSNPGAWIVRNSWGTEWGDKGYYYIAYEEGSLTDGVAYVTKPAPLNEIIYQHDPLGCVGWFGSDGARKSQAANVFTSESYDDAIGSVSFYTAAPSVECNIKIYLNCTNDPLSGTVAAEKTLKIEAPGYHTVTLDAPIPLRTKGIKFAVVVEQTSDRYDVKAPIEYPFSKYSSKARANAGESWYFDYNTSKFIDLTTKEANANFCIKAFTVPKVLVTSIVLNHGGFTIKEGQSTLVPDPDNPVSPPDVALGVTNILPAGASNKNLTWTTSDPRVVQIVNYHDTAWCVVKGIKTGSAVIRATARDGSGVFAACNVTVTPGTEPTDVKVSEINLDTQEKEIIKGEAFTVKASATPENATNKSVAWSVSDSAILYIVSSDTKSCRVEGIRAGEANITASALDGSGKSAACTVSVAASVSSVTITPSPKAVKKGEVFELKATVMPEDAKNKAVEWSVNDTSLLEIVSFTDNTCRLKALETGNTDVTATAKDVSGKSATCTVTIEPILVSSIVIAPTAKTVKVGDEFKITSTVTPENATNKAINWSSDNENVATVENGTVTAKAVGTAKITAAAADASGKSAVCIVTVEPILVYSLTVTPTTKTLKIGEEFTVSVAIAPENATNKTISWTVSDPSVLEVVSSEDNQCKFKALKGGQAEITAKTLDGSNKSAKCYAEVIVKSLAVVLDSTSKEIGLEEFFELRASVLPEDTTDKAVDWSVSNNNILQIVDYGDNICKIKGLKEGSADVTATARDGSGKSAKCTVSVVLKVSSVTLDAAEKAIRKGEAFIINAKVLPDNAVNKTLEWTTSDPSVLGIEGSNLAKKITALKAGTAYITAKATDGSGKSATCKVAVEDEERPAPSPVVPSNPTMSELENLIPASDAASFETDSTTGKAVIKQAIADKALKELEAILAEKKLARDGNMSVFPVLTANAKSAGDMVAVSFDMTGSAFSSINNIEELRLVKVFPSGNSELFDFAAKPGEIADKAFTILDKAGNIKTGDITDKTGCSLIVYIKDGGGFDIDGKANGTVVDPVGVIKVKASSPAPQPEPTSGGGGGCNADFGGQNGSFIFALGVAAVFFVLYHRKKK